jgi:hypothetical protein
LTFCLGPENKKAAWTAGGLFWNRGMRLTDFLRQRLGKAVKVKPEAAD